jgi:hypothetical protein
VIYLRQFATHLRVSSVSQAGSLPFWSQTHFGFALGKSGRTTLAFEIQRLGIRRIQIG